MTSRCDRCGEEVEDIDAGFSPGLQEMRHDCGGTWRVVEAPDSTDPLDEQEALRRIREAASAGQIVMPPCSWCDAECEVLAGDLRACYDHLDELAQTHPAAADRARRHRRQ